MPRINLRDVAKVAGVSLATVSYALRDQARIAPSTRVRVRQLAASLGYHADPRLAGLGMRRWERGASVGLAFLAPPRQQWTACQERCFAGAVEQAERQGYQLQHAAVDDFPSPAALSEELEQRACAGVIVRNIDSDEQFAGFAWERFAVVACGRGAIDPRCHIVMPHHGRNFASAWQSLRSAGVKRIGVVLVEGDAQAEMPSFYLSAMLQAQHGRPAEERIPAFTASAYERTRFGEWLSRHRPEGIIGSVDRVHAWIANAAAPRPLHFASLEKSSHDGQLAGIDLQPQVLGRIAVEALDRALRANERGLPEIRHIIQIESPWCAGRSLGDSVPERPTRDRTHDRPAHAVARRSRPPLQRRSRAGRTVASAAGAADA